MIFQVISIKPVPGEAAVVENIVVGFEDEVGEPIFSTTGF
jgi:hypothetical protein